MLPRPKLSRAEPCQPHPEHMAQCDARLRPKRDSAAKLLRRRVAAWRGGKIHAGISPST
eukprot:CAMPEP_0176327784 /NCGR_PEP_ID=MMETSP0121_2-20121125/74627_1 /TAXON_ID=160619 /ORGANISM="Kryptoperidinium foliaceum, Strain CCMP 1326" /LENGTH=58 /DNA_ID=CAMNT_0017670437 /DNA_START=18 /DNA_END=190 /DNA_ORIENTATION=+